MKNGNGTTPVPGNNPYSEAIRQKVLDGLNGRLESEEARIEERKDNFYNTLLPLVDITSEENRQARQIAYKQNNETRNIFHKYQQYQEKLRDLQYQQQQRMEDAMAQYSSTGMREQRDKAGAEAGATFDEQIAEMKKFMAGSFEQYTTNQIKSDSANQYSIATRFDNIHAYNNAISEGFSLASAQMDLGDLKRQIGLFDAMG